MEEKIDFGKRIAKFIKTKESLFMLIVIILMFLYIPFKIISYGWTPEDDALRHVAFSTINAKWSDIVVMDEKYDADHNAGWHTILKFLYNYCNFQKEDLMIFSVVSLFFLLNICGIIVSPLPISWCLSLLIILNTEPVFLFRTLLGRPYILSCAFTLLILRLWTINNLEDEKGLLKSKYFIYSLTILLISLCIWIHGSWYLFLIIPFSLLLSGRFYDAFKLSLLIIISTFIGAFLSGDFYKFLYYHTFATFNIFNEQTYNWILVTEFFSGMHTVNWSLFTAFIIWLSVYKCNYKLEELSNDSCFIMILLCWLLSIWVMRFWTDWGVIALLFWLSQKLSGVIKNIGCLKKTRVRYCLSIFIVVSLILCFTNDSKGKFTKSSINNSPIDFYNEETLDRLKGWEPQEGGIIYSNNMCCFYQLFYEYPNAKWKYILGFESAIMPKEDLKIYRKIQVNGFEEDFLPWVNKMTEKDRLILTSELTAFPQLEWIRGSRKWWIGRLKKKMDLSANDQGQAFQKSK